MTATTTTEGGEHSQSRRDNCGGGHLHSRDATIVLTAAPGESCYSVPYTEINRKSGWNMKHKSDVVRDRRSACLPGKQHSISKAGCTMMCMRWYCGDNSWSKATLFPPFNQVNKLKRQAQGDWQIVLMIQESWVKRGIARRNWRCNFCPATAWIKPSVRGKKSSLNSFLGHMPMCGQIGVGASGKRWQ